MNIFIVGNGTSRKNFDLNALKDKGLIAICNEAYKEFMGFDYIVSTDGITTADIIKNCNHDNYHIYKYGSYVFLQGPGVDVERIGEWMPCNSGQLAISHIGSNLHLGMAQIYLLGFDLGGPRMYSKKIIKEPEQDEVVLWERLLHPLHIINVSDGKVHPILADKTISYEAFNDILQN